jgi:AcrR family transcriptional regulator
MDQTPEKPKQPGQGDLPNMQDFIDSMPEQMKLPDDPDSPPGRILTAAREIFAEQGYDAASTREIAERAEVNQAMIHYYFRNKRGLYHRVLATQMVLLFTTIARATDSSQPPEEFIIRLPLRMINVLRTNPVWQKLMRRELAAGGEALQEVVIALGDHGPVGFREMMRQRYRAGVERGRLRELHFDGVSQLLISIAYTTIVIDPLFTLVSGSSILEGDAWEARGPVFESILRHGLMKEGEQ